MESPAKVVQAFTFPSMWGGTNWRGKMYKQNT